MKNLKTDEQRRIKIRQRSLAIYLRKARESKFRLVTAFAAMALILSVNVLASGAFLAQPVAAQADCCSDAGPVPVDIVAPKEFEFELSGRDANPSDQFFKYAEGNTIIYDDESCSYALDLTFDFSWTDENGNPVSYPVSYYVEYVDLTTEERVSASGTTRVDPLLTGPLCFGQLILVNEPFGPEYF